MKKLLLTLTAAALISSPALAENKAPIEATRANTSYAASTDMNGWTIANAAFISIDGVNAPTLNGKTTAVGSITSPTLTGGLDQISFKYANTFSENKGVSLKIEIKQDGAVVKTQTLTNTDVTQKEIYTFTSEPFDVQGDFVMVITNLHPSNNSSSNKDRVSIWNLTWTNFGGIALPYAPISWPQESYTMAIGNPNLQSLVLTNTDNLPVTYTSSDENVATVDADGQITLVAKGTTEISATFEGNDQYKATTVSYSLEVKDWRFESTISFAEEEYEVELGTDFVSPIPFTMGVSSLSDLVWSSSNEDVATVNDLGKVTILGLGTTVITVVFNGDDQNQPASGSYTLKVMKSVVLPEGDKDVLTVSSFTALAASTKTSSYMEDSYTSPTTGITYSAQMAKTTKDSDGSMQFRTTNSNSGIVVTANPQNRILKAIVVEWDSTTGDRTVDFYGSNTAYTAPSDLYGDNKGTKLGSTAKEDGDDFIQEPDENYYFAGFPSNSGALYLTKVTFVWGTDTATGIAAVEAENGEAVYFDMMGRRVAEPTEGIFIKVQNGKAVKVMK